MAETNGDAIAQAQKQPLADVLQKRCSYKFCNIHRMAASETIKARIIFI